jgi:phosphoribosylformylglycinamidine synthase
MVYRVYTEKKEEYALEARSVFKDIRELLKIKTVTGVRELNRYDVENISKELFDYCVGTIFSEPQLDHVHYSLPNDGAKVFAVEYLPGQYDQRADSASQCIQIVSQGERPLVKSAKVYLLYGEPSDEDIQKIQNHLINPVESRLASLAEAETLQMKTVQPDSVAMVENFITMNDDELKAFLNANGLAMDFDDMLFCRNYFRTENRNPTITEIKLIDTYWSDHCRHTTFTTHIDNIVIDDSQTKQGYENYLKLRGELGRTKPVTLMDIATIGAKYLKSKGILKNLDESDEINACTVRIDVDVNGKDEEYLLLFKNETHNHPTEIEPFGGAATCIGGAIRDPLSGRSYVYQAMRVTGAANPLTPIEQTMKGKLPQRTIVTEAARGYSSYGNQIGLATGLVDEIYHDGYAAKRMEIGAVLGAAPSRNVKREKPVPGDVIILLGGRTGRDGCGGATGSSKSHTLESLEHCGAEVQKGNAPEERKLQRLFRNSEAAKLIKKCNDFGAGGVSVAIGELADGLDIDLDKVPKKYEGLDGTELAISESQERMAVLLDKRC